VRAIFLLQQRQTASRHPSAKLAAIDDVGIGADAGVVFAGRLRWGRLQRRRAYVSLGGKPVEERWKTYWLSQKIALRGIYLVSAPKNADCRLVYTALSFRSFRTI
jgi:hypothetical protein